MILSTIKAGIAYAYTWVRPLDPVVEYCNQGHSVLWNWPYCPDCLWLAKICKNLKKRKNSKPSLFLYCVEGNHQGELFAVPEDGGYIGVRTDDVVVVTPKRIPSGIRFRISHNSTQGNPPTLISETTHSFKLNGIETWKEVLLDFDELEILENRFLVLSAPEESLKAVNEGEV